MLKLTERILKNELKNLKFNEPLKKWTTFKIGGPARYFFIAENKKNLIKTIKTAQKLKIPYFILGGGSNILVSDKGFNGLVIKIQNSKFKIQNSRIIAEAGVLLGELVAAATAAGLAGLEWAVGIPGTVGGAIVGNTGWSSNNKNIASVIESVEVLEIGPKLRIKNYRLKDCQFAYRNSIFRRNKNLIIISAVLKLKRGDKGEIKAKILENLKEREKKIPKGFSAGCIFKNVKYSIAGRSGRVSTLGVKSLRFYPEWENFKRNKMIPAGWLVEKCGLKGKKLGGAKISEKHANFIINQGKARAKDVLKLIKIIKNKVIKKFGAKLEEEIELVGF
jgi:UDP-N-acetylmuramate dehydrogenase